MIAARTAVLVAFHLMVFAGCYVLAFLVRFEWAPPEEAVRLLRSTAPFVVSLQLIVGGLFGFYRGWWRYVGMRDVFRLVLGLTVSLALLIAAWYFGSGLLPRFTHYFTAPRGVLIIDWAFSLLTLFGARAVIRVGRDRFRPAEAAGELRRVLIIGAGDAGESLAREIEYRPQLGMKVVGFVDDQRAKWGWMIRGIKVTGPIASIRAVADLTGASEALIAIPSASGKRIREIITHLSEAGLEFKTIPGIDNLVNGKLQVTQLRAVNIEDLLRRERIELPGDPVRAMFAGKCVLVTGAGGTIGGELASQIVRFEPRSLVLLERSEFALYEVRKRLARQGLPHGVEVINALVDVQNSAVVKELLSRTRPDIVLHAAAHKHVPLGEENPTEYVRNNSLATRDLAELCAEAGVGRFVLISTDKAINPTSVMGASKRAAEILLLDIVRRHETMQAVAVRFGNVIGSSGSVVPLFMEQIQQGGPITVTHPDVTRYFLRTSEAVSLVLQAATLGNRGDVFMLDMGEPVRIVELARDLIKLSNHTEEEIPIVFSGLRAGEKLFEELRLDGESTRPTVHPQIVVTLAPQPESAIIANWQAKVREDCVEGRDVLHHLRELIPEYRTPVEPARHTPSLPIRRRRGGEAVPEIAYSVGGPPGATT